MGKYEIIENIVRQQKTIEEKNMVIHARKILIDYIIQQTDFLTNSLSEINITEDEILQAASIINHYSQEQIVENESRKVKIFAVNMVNEIVVY